MREFYRNRMRTVRDLNSANTNRKQRCDWNEWDSLWDLREPCESKEPHFSPTLPFSPLICVAILAFSGTGLSVQMDRLKNLKKITTV